MKEIVSYKRAPLKELFLILLGFVLNSGVYSKSESIKDIATSSGWKALLYYQNESFMITDDKFYLSPGKRSLLSELEALIKELEREDNQNIVCRFPARYYFLVMKLGYPEAPLDRCGELSEFKTRAPLEKAYVMFASENISIPSSMMGHIYLKISGVNHKNIPVDHALSFYTDVDGINFPKLVVESLLIGKKGLYSLSPGGPVKENYIFQEGRNVWEFELDLTNSQKVLLQNHLYELKNIKLTYYFHLFNCATLIKQIIRVANPVEEEPKIEWTSPLDVVRFIYKHDLIASQSVNMSSKWKIKSLIDSSDFETETLKKIKDNDVKNVIGHLKDKNETYQLTTLELYKAYISHQIETEKKFSESNKFKLKEISSYIEDNLPDNQLDFSNYKNPVKTKSTAQVIASYANEKNESVAKLTFLPASHFLEDESSQYISESELQISRLTLAQNFKSNKFFVDELNIYSATSFLPSDVLIQGLSGKFRMGYLNYFDYDLHRKKSVILEGALGKTYRIHTDVDYFSMFGLNYLEANNVVLSPRLETGFILREIFDMKTIFSVGIFAQDILKNENLIEYKLKHFIDLGDYGVVIELLRLQNRNESMHNYSVGLKKYF